MVEAEDNNSFSAGDERKVADNLRSGTKDRKRKLPFTSPSGPLDADPRNPRRGPSPQVVIPRLPPQPSVDAAQRDTAQVNTLVDTTEVTPAQVNSVRIDTKMEKNDDSGSDTMSVDSVIPSEPKPMMQSEKNAKHHPAENDVLASTSTYGFSGKTNPEFKAAWTLKNHVHGGEKNAKHPLAENDVLAKPSFYSFSVKKKLEFKARWSLDNRIHGGENIEHMNSKNPIGLKQEQGINAIKAQTETFNPEASKTETEQVSSDALCALCSAPGVPCKNCQGIRYCSSECELEDLPTHEALCRTFSLYTGHFRPTSKPYRAILMSAKSDRPRWIWLQGGHDPKIAIHLNLLGRSSGLSTAEIGSGIMTATISRNGILGRELHDDLTIFYRAPSITDSSSANKCISIATAYLSPLRWVGSVVVCATLCDGSLRDLEPSDYRYVVDALSVSDLQNDAWLAFTEEGPPKQAPRTGRVEAVCIDCDGERLIRGTASARKILLPRLHPQGKWVRTTELPRIADLYTSDGINRTSVKPSFTNRLEIPIRTWQVAPDRAWTVAASRNPLVSFLHFNTRRLNNKLTSNDIDVAMKAELYQTCPGSVFLARSDGKPLLPEHVEAIAAFARFVILPHAQHLGGYDEVDWSRPEDIVGSREMVVLLTEFEKYRGGQAEMNEAAILSFIERRVFRKFWELYKEKKGWEDVLSPYDV